MWQNFRQLADVSIFSSLGTAVSSFVLLTIFNSLMSRSIADDVSEATIQRTTYEQSTGRLSVNTDEKCEGVQIEIIT